MSLVYLSSSVVPSSCFNQCKIYNFKPHGFASPFSYSPFYGKSLCCITKNIHAIVGKRVHGILRSPAVDCMKHNHQSLTGEEDMISFDLGDQEKDGMEDVTSPWEGAVIYKRNSSISHMEYCTTLERLGLGNLSTEVSKSRASVMGIRVTKSVKDYPLGTPVQISIDITRKKQKLRLDGIVKTVITLGCNRYAFCSVLLCVFPLFWPDFKSSKNNSY